MAEVSTAAIITAAGLGKRFGEGTPKQFVPIGGEPVLVRCIKNFSNCGSIADIVVVVPPDRVEYTQNEIVNKFRLEKVSKIVPGADERQHSVQKGFLSISDKPDIVVVHDGVRPFINNGIIERVIGEAVNCGAAICAVQATDTVKQSSPDMHIEHTLPRDTIWLAQTPQAFRYEILREAMERARKDGYTGTDESLLVERMGVKVKLVPGSPHNIKITTKEDIHLAELILKEGIDLN